MTNAVLLGLALASAVASAGRVRSHAEFVQRLSAPGLPKELPKAQGKAAPPSMGLSKPKAPLSGDLFYATCNLPQCSTLALAMWSLENSTGTVVYDFPVGSFEDGYVADVLRDGTQVILSLQYDSRPAQGELVTFDTGSSSIVSSFNATQCFNAWIDPNDSDTIICLALQAACDGGSQCSELRHISRSKKTDTLVSSFLPNMAPYTVSCLDLKRGLIYSLFGGLTTNDNVFASIDPYTGAITSNVSFPLTTAYIELEYDSVTDKVYAVVQEADGTYFASVEPSTGAYSPVGPAFNRTYWGQFNTISTIAPEIGTFFSTAFHYDVPGPPPSDPILHLIGNDLATGAIVYDEVVQNPFCEILWFPQ